MDIIITHEEARNMLKEYKEDPAKFIEECMEIKLLRYQREFINKIMDETEEQSCINKLL